MQGGPGGQRQPRPPYNMGGMNPGNMPPIMNGEPGMMPGFPNLGGAPMGYPGPRNMQVRPNMNMDPRISQSMPPGMINPNANMGGQPN